jgi:hypothetical protein
MVLDPSAASPQQGRPRYDLIGLSKRHGKSHPRSTTVSATSPCWTHPHHPGAKDPVSLDQYLDLLTEKKAFANLATVMPDGTPQVRMTYEVEPVRVSGLG